MKSNIAEDYNLKFDEWFLENMPEIKKHFQLTWGFDHHGRKPGTNRESKILGVNVMLKDRSNFEGHDFIIDMVSCENKSNLLSKLNSC